MKLTRVIAVGVILGTLALGGLNAQTLRKSAPPAEFPPASFKGKQYVDSRGCIYIRAGIDGNVTWVPRVSRSRKQVCGYKPTVTAGSQPTPAPKTARAPVVITANPPAATPKPTPPQTAAPATPRTVAPKVAARPAPAAAPRTAAAPARQKPSPGPAPTVVGSPKPAATAAPRVAASPAPKATSQRKPSPGPAPTVVGSPKPTATAAPKVVASPAPKATSRRKPSPGPAPTVVASTRPAAPAPRTTAAVAPVPATAAPRQYKPSPGPAPTVIGAAKPTAPAGPTATATTAPQAAPARARACGNASTFSQQFINKPGGRYKIRCGPQAEPPVTYGQPATYEQSENQATAAAGLAPGTRVVPRHVYDNRQNTNNVAVPSGYRPVWDDGRLNPRRAERTLSPAQVQGVITVPSGYKIINWGDGRLNLNRGIRTARGDAQSNQIWSNTVPRTLLPQPTRGRVVVVAPGTARAQDPQTSVTRVSTRSGPAASDSRQGSKRIYVRVATYGTEDDARSVARSLARSGLPMRLGTIKSSGNRVVLAGPFASKAEARTALNKVRGAGYRKARLSN